MTGGIDEPTTCTVCWALVPRQMMTFHRDWHASFEAHADVALPQPRLRAIEPASA